MIKNGGKIYTNGSKLPQGMQIITMGIKIITKGRKHIRNGPTWPHERQNDHRQNQNDHKPRREAKWFQMDRCKLTTGSQNNWSHRLTKGWTNSNTKGCRITWSGDTICPQIWTVDWHDFGLFGHWFLNFCCKFSHFCSVHVSLTLCSTLTLHLSKVSPHAPGVT